MKTMMLFFSWELLRIQNPVCPLMCFPGGWRHNSLASLQKFSSLQIATFLLPELDSGCSPLTLRTKGECWLIEKCCMHSIKMLFYIAVRAQHLLGDWRSGPVLRENTIKNKGILYGVGKNQMRHYLGEVYCSWLHLVSKQQSLFIIWVEIPFYK